MKRQSLEIGNYGEWSIRLIECEHSYPVILKDKREVNVLFNTELPRDVQSKFWSLFSEYNKFLESPEKQVPDEELEESYMEEDKYES